MFYLYNINHINIHLCCFYIYCELYILMPGQTKERSYFDAFGKVKGFGEIGAYIGKNAFGPKGLPFTIMSIALVAMYMNTGRDTLTIESLEKSLTKCENSLDECNKNNTNE